MIEQGAQWEMHQKTRVHKRLAAKLHREQLRREQ